MCFFGLKIKQYVQYAPVLQESTELLGSEPAVNLMERQRAVVH